MTSYADLLIWQYKDKPKAYRLIDSLGKMSAEYQQVILDLSNGLGIGTAQGTLLDYVGTHIGLSRHLSKAAPMELFGFIPNKGMSKGGAGGSRFWRYGTQREATVRLEDTEYRFLLKAAVAKFCSTGTIPELQAAIEYLMGVGTGTVKDGEDMTINVIVYREISAFERYVLLELDMLPRPPGVGIKVVWQSSAKAFGFLGGKNVAAMGVGKFMRILA